MQEFLEIIRPSQWYKNLIIFIPLISSLNLFSMDLWFSSLLGFATLCLAFGGSYVINDVLDRKRDSSHPIKAKRPIPSGRISINRALTYGIALIIASESLAILLGTNFFIIISFIIMLTNVYSIWIKNIFLVESFFISVNYVLRGLAGALAIDVRISPWLIIGVFFVALLLVFGKRKSEISFLNNESTVHRSVLKNYTSELLNYAIPVTCSTIILAYAVYSINGPPGIDDWRLVLTIPVVFFILTRYMFRNLRGEYYGKEFNDFLMRDKQLLGSILVYAALAIFLLYFAPDSYFE